MKIRQKIALIFTILTSIVLLFSFIFIYFLSARYAKKDFYDRLQGKALLTAWKYFEKDELSQSAYKLVIDKYVQNLPEAKEIILNTADSITVRDSLNRLVSPDLAKKLLSKQNIKFKIRNRQGVGIYYPDNQGNFIVLITAFDQYGIHRQDNLLKVLVIIFLVGIAMVFLVGQFYAKKVLAPIVNIMRNVRKINATNLSLRLKEKSGKDELSELGHMFNQMLERLENSFALQRNFIHNASHELKNPITAILGQTEVTLSKNRTAEEYVSNLRIIMAETERLEQLTRNLLAMAQTDFDMSSLPVKKIRIDEMMTEINDSINKTEYKHRLEFNYTEKYINHEGYNIYGIPSLLRGALVNLFENACKFSLNRPVIVNINKFSDQIHISITDKGIGIPANEINNLFQPFYRANNALSFKGSGIGLSLVKKIIDLHGGNINISSELGKGTVVELNLPELLVNGIYPQIDN